MKKKGNKAWVLRAYELDSIDAPAREHNADLMILAMRFSLENQAGTILLESHTIQNGEWNLGLRDTHCTFSRDICMRCIPTNDKKKCRKDVHEYFSYRLCFLFRM